MGVVAKNIACGSYLHILENQNIFCVVSHLASQSITQLWISDCDRYVILCPVSAIWMLTMLCRFPGHFVILNEMSS